MSDNHTSTELPVPLDVFTLFREVFGEIGEEHRITITVAGDDERIDMTGVHLSPDREQDIYLVTSGFLSDHDTALGEEAFMAGYQAAKRGDDPHHAWSGFTPSPALYETLSRYNKDAS